MRRVFQFDGLNGGVLSVGECEAEARVALCVHNGETEVQMFLSREDFYDLADLRYSINFTEPEEARQQLKAA
jgi:hypothetical protein